MASFLSIKVVLLSTFILAANGLAIDGRATTDVPHCNDVIATGAETTDGIDCYLNMTAATGKRNAVVEELGAALDGRDDTIPVTVDATNDVTVTCANNIPSAIDSGNLCSNTVPTSVTLTPAYSATQASCKVWYSMTAAFAICNADTCSSARFTAQKQTCNLIYNTCSRSNKGGYVLYSYPNGLSSLYRQGGQDQAPLYSNC